MLVVPGCGVVFLTIYLATGIQPDLQYWWIYSIIEISVILYGITKILMERRGNI